MTYRAISRRLRDLAYPSIPFVITVLVWEFGARAGCFPSYILPAPTAIFDRLIKTANLLFHHAVVTTLEIVIGFALAVIVGVMLAVVIVLVRAVYRSVYPWLVFVQVIPKVALGPLLAVWLGFGFAPKVLMAFLLSFFPIMISAMIGLRSVETDATFLLRTMGAGPCKTLFYLQLPTALPGIFGSLKVAITLATVGAIVGEFIGANQGLGYVLITANGVLDTILIFVALSWISVLALLLYGLVALLERPFVHWHVSHRTQMALATA
jgi:NitT/TauT family transport system permease protein